MKVRTAFNILGPLLTPAGAASGLIGVYSPAISPLMASTLQRLGTKRALVVHSHGLDELTPMGDAELLEVTPQGTRRYRQSPPYTLAACLLADVQPSYQRLMLALRQSTGLSCGLLADRQPCHQPPHIALWAEVHLPCNVVGSWMPDLCPALLCRLDPLDLGIKRCEVKDLAGGDARLNASILGDVFGGARSAVADALNLNAGVALAACEVAGSPQEGVAMAQVRSHYAYARLIFF